MMTKSEKRFRQLGKKLLQPHARLIEEEGADEDFVLIRRGKSDKKLARIDRAEFVDWLKADFLKRDGDDYEVSAVGRANLRRHLGGDFIAQHHLDNAADHEGVPRHLASTPLQWLQARGRSKAFGLNDMELQAGERLHDDFHRARREAHQTMDWSRPVYVDGGASNKADDIPQGLLDAQKRVAQALAYIGPGLADMAVDVCCCESGLEATEKKYALPRRSAKIMLKLALMRLSVHYGYQSASAAAASFRIRRTMA